MKTTELKTGDILHCKGKSLLSKLIMFFTSSKFSHSALVVETWGQLYVVDAQKNGVNPRPLLDWIKHYNYDVKVSVPIVEFDVKAFSIKCFSKVGFTPYDFVSFLVYQPYYLITGKWVGKTNENANGSMYCSEFVGWIHQSPNYWELSPKDIFNLFSQSANFITYDLEKDENIVN